MKVHTSIRFDAASFSRLLANLTISEPICSAFNHVFDFDLEEARSALLARNVSSWEQLFSEAIPNLAVLLARALAVELEAADTVIEDDLNVAEATAFIGNLRVSGDVNVESNLWVAGDLEARTVSDAEGDGAISVARDLRAGTLETGGQTSILGRVECKVVRCLGNDGSLIVGGDLVTELLDQDDHDVGCYGRVSTYFHLSTEGYTGQSTEESGLLKALAPALHHEPDEDYEVLDWNAIMETAAKGSSLWAKGAALSRQAKSIPPQDE
ncbi:MAG: hypothetical protein H6729_17075 [Deltaproteobacteria bacterium]|nr:hypothetical protein [Deltaproteobacteria bacterium]